MDAAIESAGAAEAAAAAPAPQSWRTPFAPPPMELSPFTPAELHDGFRGGEVAADDCERLLAWAARAAGALDVAIGEGLHALRQGDRLARLGCHLDDYAREALDLGRRTAENLARLGAALRTRPLLREALRAGRVRIRAAETVLPVAVGEAEARWVERAATDTVRELEAEVRRARSGGADEEEDDWVQLRTHLPPHERTVLDAGMDLAGALMPGSSRAAHLEALAQEYLAEFSRDADGDDARPLGPAFRAQRPARKARGAQLEAEMDRWVDLPGVPAMAAPDVRFDETASAGEVDATLRALARLRTRWDDLIGYCALALKRSGIHRFLGFADFRQYVEERLQLPPRAVEQRAALEERLWRSPALQEARRQGVAYEKLRVLAPLRESDIASWIPRAHGLTCIALRRAVEGERERQMRAARNIAVPLPRRVAVLLAAAVQTVRGRVRRFVGAGSCLAVMAAHFIETWGGSVKGPASRSQKVRARDEGFCQVPGCSRRAADSHHVEFRSHGGSDDPTNQTSVCGFHHHRCLHGGYLAVSGRAPDALTWLLRGEPWVGPGLANAAAAAQELA